MPSWDHPFTWHGGSNYGIPGYLDGGDCGMEEVTRESQDTWMGGGTLCHRGIILAWGSNLEIQGHVLVSLE